MKCIDCKWFSGIINDTYGLCKRYPRTQNKTQHDWCGDFVSKVEEIETTKYNIATDEIKPKRGRKPKNVD